jgi:hypothetical protein
MGLKRILLLVIVAAFGLLPGATLLAADEPASCAASASTRQLDYWLGDWAVASPGMAGRGHSSVHLSLDKCLLVESWGSDTSNHNGENYLAYNAEEKTWYGLFVDNHGRIHMMKGSVAPGSAELVGPARDETGVSVLKKVKVVRIDDDKVEQIWEKSVDNGATWTIDFKMEYVRRKP